MCLDVDFFAFASSGSSQLLELCAVTYFAKQSFQLLFLLVLFYLCLFSLLLLP